MGLRQIFDIRYFSFSFHWKKCHEFDMNDELSEMSEKYMRQRDEKRNKTVKSTWRNYLHFHLIDFHFLYILSLSRRLWQFWKSFQLSQSETDSCSQSELTYTHITHGYFALIKLIHPPRLDILHVHITSSSHSLLPTIARVVFDWPIICYEANWNGNVNIRC